MGSAVTHSGSRPRPATEGEGRCGNDLLRLIYGGAKLKRLTVVFRTHGQRPSKGRSFGNSATSCSSLKKRAKAIEMVHIDRGVGENPRAAPALPPRAPSRRDFFSCVGEFPEAG